MITTTSNSWECARVWKVISAGLQKYHKTVNKLIIKRFSLTNFKFAWQIRPSVNYQITMTNHSTALDIIQNSWCRHEKKDAMFIYNTHVLNLVHFYQILVQFVCNMFNEIPFTRLRMNYWWTLSERRRVNFDVTCRKGDNSLSTFSNTNPVTVLVFSIFSVVFL